MIVHAHPDPKRGDGITDMVPSDASLPDFAALIRAAEDEAMSRALRRSEGIG